MPQFAPSSVHKATATFSNPKSAGFDYSASFCMGAAWTEMASASFHLDAGQSKAIAFSVTMPATSGTYPVYLKVTSSGVVIGTFVATEDVTILPAVAKFVYVTSIAHRQEVIGSGTYFIVEVDVQNQGNVDGTCTLVCYCSFKSFYWNGPIPVYTAWEIPIGLPQYEVLQAYIKPGQIVTFRKLINFYDYFERADHTVMRVKFVGDPGEIVSTGFLVRE